MDIAAASPVVVDTNLGRSTLQFICEPVMSV